MFDRNGKEITDGSIVAYSFEGDQKSINHVYQQGGVMMIGGLCIENTITNKFHMTTSKWEENPIELKWYESEELTVLEGLKVEDVSIELAEKFFGGTQ